jgi:hypothetical protein
LRQPRGYAPSLVAVAWVLFATALYCVQLIGLIRELG